MERKLFYNHRPLKIAYIIDEFTSLDDIKNIILYSLGVRGGRYYQFFLLDNGSGAQNISDIDLKRMESYDADVYICLCELEQALKEKIIIKFSPSDILDNTQFSIEKGYLRLNGDYIRTNPVSIMPCKNLTSQIGFGYHKLVNFIVDPELGDDLKDLIRLNFGYTQNKGRHYKHYLDTVDHEDISINDIHDLINFFDGIDYRYYIYQNQLSHAPYNYFGKLNFKADHIYLVIGDSVKDYIMFWNRNIHNSSWKSSFINTFILPISNLEKSKDILQSFLRFVSQSSRYQNQNNQRPNVVIISNAFTEEQLKTVDLNGFSVRIESVLDIYENADFGNYRYASIDHRKYQSLYDESNTIRLDKEELWNTPMANEIYATDVFLEYKKSDHIINTDGSAQVSYLEYSRNNNATHGIFSSRMVRVNFNRSFSIIFDKSEGESFTGRESNDNRFELRVKFPSDSGIIRSIMLSPHFGDMRNHRNFKDIKQSPEGKKAKAIIALCKGNYYFLGNLLDNEKWRDLFIKYTQIFKKEIIEEQIQNILNKKGIPQDTLPEKIYKACFKTLTLNDKYISFDKIKSETGIGNDSDELEDLIEIGILRQGIEFKCSLCGEKYWLSVNDMREVNICRGCGRQSHIDINPIRHYAFNSILNGSDAKGTFAVLHFLAKLSSFHSGSFIYGLGIECVDLDKNQKEISIGDCDIICLRNGLLIFVEVKYDRSGFGKSDFENFKKISKKVKPDIIIFASYGKPTKSVNANLRKWIDDIRGDAEMYGIKISYEQIESFYMH